MTVRKKQNKFHYFHQRRRRRKSRGKRETDMPLWNTRTHSLHSIHVYSASTGQGRDKNDKTETRARRTFRREYQRNENVNRGPSWHADFRRRPSFRWLLIRTPAPDGINERDSSALAVRLFTAGRPRVYVLPRNASEARFPPSSGARVLVESVRVFKTHRPTARTSVRSGRKSTRRSSERPPWFVPGPTGSGPERGRRRDGHEIKYRRKAFVRNRSETDRHDRAAAFRYSYVVRRGLVVSFSPACFPSLGRRSRDGETGRDFRARRFSLGDVSIARREACSATVTTGARGSAGSRAREINRLITAVILIDWPWPPKNETPINRRSGINRTGNRKIEINQTVQVRNGRELYGCQW